MLIFELKDTKLISDYFYINRNNIEESLIIFSKYTLNPSIVYESNTVLLKINTSESSYMYFDFPKNAKFVFIGYSDKSWTYILTEEFEALN